MEDQRLQLLKQKIVEKAFVTKEQAKIVTPQGKSGNWLFDFRNLFADSADLSVLADVFLDQCKDRPVFQVGGMELAGIPLVTAIGLRAHERGLRINTFFIRKSRKKEGLMRPIEGTLTDDPVILVDDLVNSGKSLFKQIGIVESFGKHVAMVFTVLRFREESYYTQFAQRGITVKSLFSLQDLPKELGVTLSVKNEPTAVPMPFSIVWFFESPNPNYHYVVPKSTPALSGEYLYFGSDSGVFYALRKDDGSEVWRYKVPYGVAGKFIFSSPVCNGELVYFGAYDGTVYALEQETGAVRWKFQEADWVGSSPAVAPDLGLLFIGLEFGLPGKKGGVVALDLLTGEKKWEFRSSEYTHGSPAYSKKFQMVICGSNDGVVSAFDAKTGALLWQYQTGGSVKLAPAIDDGRGIVAVGSFDKHLYIFDLTSGAVMYKIETQEGIYSTPLIYDGVVYVASLDKKVYAINLNTGKSMWQFQTSGRIFASPEMIEGKIYCGSNDGRMYELDPKTGENTALFQSVERITNTIRYDNERKRFIVLTFANQVYTLERVDQKKAQ